MKKKLILGLLVLVALFTFTGCEKSKTTSKENLHKQEFVDMRYNEPKNYSQKNPYDLENDKVINYLFAEDENKHINLYYYKDKNLTGMFDEYDKTEEKEVNGFKWTIIHESDSTGDYDTYYIEHNSDLYAIELNAINKYQKDYDEFMKDVSFE